MNKKEWRLDRSLSLSLSPFIVKLSASSALFLWSAGERPTLKDGWLAGFDSASHVSLFGAPSRSHHRGPLPCSFRACFGLHAFGKTSGRWQESPFIIIANYDYYYPVTKQEISKWARHSSQKGQFGNQYGIPDRFYLRLEINIIKKIIIIKL